MSDTINTVQPQPLTREAFAPFGDVIEVSDQAHHFGINQGYTERYHNLADIDVDAEGGRAIVSIFRSTPLQQPIAIKMMERHPLSSQAFIPMGQQPYLVVVAPAGDFDESQLQVFLARSDQGVNYHKGTWHHFCLALNEQSDFLVVDRGGDGHNCDEIELTPEQQLRVNLSDNA
ncbi:ureidoglycolate lyase [Pseudomaricurvus alkylphenolicus]|jgi:ureidoglycolate lyase|uniref:ureidoglycolate lyase n=1 Tax=Pseudomaricurvus alkylphenolicus TaxID=1306991 RepID=UPI0014206B24|nr:ureidoglycolate lyase [Pseudomaricurvus alkylphenolicus]NIB40939.1 ureidoglycolate lyase [Pseudomaricurvus alkylphenolicus]